MYRLAEYEFLWQHKEEIRRAVAVERPTRVAHENRETAPYVVRDLSWEFARYLDTEGSPTSAEERMSA